MPTVSVATWNVYDGSLNGLTPLQRMQNFLAECANQDINIVAIQEVPQSLLLQPDPGIDALDSLAISNNYTLIRVPTEYPLGPASAASGSSDGYAIFYQGVDLAPGPGGELYSWFEPYAFTQGASMARPPVSVNFNLETGDQFQFLTWHAESGAMATGSVQNFSGQVEDLDSQMILAGDLNVNSDFLENGDVLDDWTGLSNGLDHVLAAPGGTVSEIDYVGQFVSDYHTAMMADVDLLFL